MSRIGQWLRNDLSKVNKPGEIGRTIRRHPMILARVVVNLVVGMLAIYAVLALFGNADAFSDWWFLAVIWAGGSGGRLISKHKTKVANPPKDPAPGS